MREWQNQAHVKWYCRYHVVIEPKYRRKSMFGVIRRDIGEILYKICRRFEVERVEGHVMPNHVLMCLGIPPKHSVFHTIGGGRGNRRSFCIRDTGARGISLVLRFLSQVYCVSTVGLDEAVIRNYIRTQEEREKREDKMDLDY